MPVTAYARYHIAIEPAPDIAPHPSRFRVEVKRHRLAALLLKELIHFRANLPVVMSRPCVYGVFSGPIGGFAPRPRKCVGCLRCTVQYPEIVEIRPNPDRLRLGDSFFTPDLVDTLLYESASGRVPVRGAGYRGGFGGEGWDGMWTDMSEIVRPTRDGIHGREFISTAVDLGSKPAFLELDDQGFPRGELPQVVSLPLPFLFDPPAEALAMERVAHAVARAAQSLGTLALIPLRRALELGLDGRAVAPVVATSESQALDQLSSPPSLLFLDRFDPELLVALRRRYPETVVGVRLPFERDLMPLVEAGARVFHLTADYHGSTAEGFVLEAIRATHDRLVEAGWREQITLVGSGGIIAAEHVPKAIICGLDAVALDSSLLIALQGRFRGEVKARGAAQIEIADFDIEWGAQRLVNLAASWRDQLLEILGAMGLREVRRLRGEIGRAMFQADLEQEAFAGIAGFPAAGANGGRR